MKSTRKHIRLHTRQDIHVHIHTYTHTNEQNNVLRIEYVNGNKHGEKKRRQIRPGLCKAKFMLVAFKVDRKVQG